MQSKGFRAYLAEFLVLIVSIINRLALVHNTRIAGTVSQPESMAQFVRYFFYEAILEKNSQPIVTIGRGMRQQSLKVYSCYAPSNNCMTEAEDVITKVCVEIT